MPVALRKFAKSLTNSLKSTEATIHEITTSTAPALSQRFARRCIGA